jgi:hypothetical protein
MILTAFIKKLERDPSKHSLSPPPKSITWEGRTEQVLISTVRSSHHPSRDDPSCFKYGILLTLPKANGSTSCPNGSDPGKDYRRAKPPIRQTNCRVLDYSVRSSCIPPSLLDRNTIFSRFVYSKHPRRPRIVHIPPQDGPKCELLNRVPSCSRYGPSLGKPKKRIQLPPNVSMTRHSPSRISSRDNRTVRAVYCVGWFLVPFGLFSEDPNGVCYPIRYH